ncbi:CHC2 zinc finger domain-containing protein [Patescibacteria group bacterium]|nr:CHC2 zinc finger domain-containing protein [Patescibacteria group bacterium]
MNNLDFKQTMEEVKERIDIVQVIGKYLKLNNHNQALCPFHEEKTPSFSVNSKCQYFYCFGCGASGDVISFIQKYEKKEFWEVFTDLAHQVGVDIGDYSQEDKQKLKEEAIIEDILQETVTFYHNSLTQEVKDYLVNDRKLTEETINQFKIGFANGELRKHLLDDCKFSADLCIKAGALKDTNRSVKDYFYQRIILPNLRRGKVAYISGRSIDDTEPKYLHLKGEQKYLYNEEAINNEVVFIVEGIFDCLSLNQLGYNVVSLLSSHLKADYLNKFSKCKTIYICLDGDEAGQKATIKLGEVFLDKAKVIKLPDNLDPNDYFKDHTKEEFEELINSAPDFIQSQLEAIPRDTDKVELPKKLEIILGYLAKLDKATCEAYLSSRIKHYFNLKNDDIEGYRQLIKQYQKTQQAEIKGEEISLLPEKYTADFENLVDVAQYKGTPVFLIKEDNKLVIKGRYELEGALLLPPPKEQIPWLLADAGKVVSTYELEQDLSQNEVDEKLYDDLLEYHKSISQLPDDSYYDLLAAWDFHTYCLEQTEYTPIICLFAVPERGKSRTGKGMIYVAYRGIHVESLRDPYLVRVANDLNATLFFDVKDIWKKAEKEKSEDILLHRFEKGARVPRVLYPEKGAHKDIVYYKIFGSTVIATNEGVHHILETRAIQINMPETDRHFENTVTPEKALALKERLIAYRARHLYEQLPDVFKPANGRLGDILRPLYQIIKAIKPEREDSFLQLIKTLEKERMIEKSDSLEAQILLVVTGLQSQVERGVLPVKLITDTINESKQDEYKFSYQRIGRRLNALGFKKAKTADGSSAIIWDGNLLERVKQRYGVGETPETSEIPDSSSEGDGITDHSDNTGVLSKANGESVKYITDKQLMDQEDFLRKALIFLDKNTPEYEEKYKEWFALREEGLRRKLFENFVPTNQQELAFSEGGNSDAAE